MTPGDIVRCIDARYSEGRLVEGRIYVVKEVASDDRGFFDRCKQVEDTGMSLMVHGAPAPGDAIRNWWKSSRFVPVNRKDLEILAKVADKIMGGA